MANAMLKTGLEVDTLAVVNLKLQKMLQFLMTENQDYGDDLDYYLTLIDEIHSNNNIRDQHSKVVVNNLKRLQETLAQERNLISQILTEINEFQMPDSQKTDSVALPLSPVPPVPPVPLVQLSFTF